MLQLLQLFHGRTDENVPLPDFITSARRELMLSAVFLDFFGAILKRQENWYCPEKVVLSGREKKKNQFVVRNFEYVRAERGMACADSAVRCGAVRSVSAGWWLPMSTPDAKNGIS